MVDSIKTKKSLGQHWLHDVDVLQDIVELADVQAGDHVVEVGPGLGTLTEYILSYGAYVTAVEFDEDLYKRLLKQSATLFSKDAERLSVVHQDILSFNFTDQKPGYKVVANIPYYLTSNLIRVLSETTNRPASLTLLIQKEVAERLCAGPGNMSLLSVWAQMYFTCELGSVVPAKLFTPPPKVDSQVVHMVCRERPIFAADEKQALTRVVQAGFSNKRKTLHNSLAAGMQITKNEAADLLTRAGITVSARPQELSLDQWLSLARVANT